jgi:endonuclease G, mitochondrial
MMQWIDKPYGSEFICDRHVRVLGFIPTPWICGGIMKPVPPNRTKLRCEECGHEKEFNPILRSRILRSTLLFAGLLAPMPVMAAAPAQQPVQSCQQFAPYGMPATPGNTHVLVCRHAYFLETDTMAKIPMWVSYTLTPDHALGCLDRSDAFTGDNTLPKGSYARPVDYEKSGYDMGHIAPDGDMRWDETVERESFLLTNMTPQLPGLNRGLWKVLETAVRAGAEQNGHILLIYAGPVYDTATDKKIGKDKIDVPTAFYKVVIDTVTGQYTAFLFPQTDDPGDDLAKVQVPLATVEQATGIKFPLSDDAKESGIWQFDPNQLEKDIKAKCKAPNRQVGQ